MTDIDLKEMREIAEKATSGKRVLTKGETWPFGVGVSVGDIVLLQQPGVAYSTKQKSRAEFEAGAGFGISERDDVVRAVAEQTANAELFAMLGREEVLALLDRLEAAEAERDAARVLLKRAGEALLPFRRAANITDRYWEDHETHWDPYEVNLPIKALRSARAIHAEIKEAIDDRSV